MSAIETLRVLAVQKDRPYAAPGDEVTLTMLWADGSEDAGGPSRSRGSRAASIRSAISTRVASRT